MQLDEYQKAAAEAEESKVLVSAAPGSGKSRVICARFSHLVEKKNVQPANIAIVTFTRYAATSLKERIGESSHGAFIGTFHSFALKMIMSWGHEIGWEGSWLTLLDEEEAKMEEKECLKDIGLMNPEGKWKKGSMGEWGKFRESVLSGSPTPELSASMARKYSAAFKSFVNRLRAENVMTFGVLILEALRLIEEVPEAKKAFKESYKHILIDESQDSDALQWKLLRALEPETLFSVGDVDQSIYSFRGACPQLFIDFANEAKVYNLPYSYRFGLNIGEPANNLISHNENRLDNTIQAIGNNEGTLNVKNEAENEEIADLIDNELTEGTEPDEIVVLARTHAILDNLAAEMKEKDLPHVKIGGKTAANATAEFRVVKGYLRLAVNPKDKRAFMAVANAEGLSNTELWSLREQALRNDTGLIEAYQKDLPHDIAELKDYLPKQDPEHGYVGAFNHVERVRAHEGFTELGDLVRYLSFESQQDALRDAKGKTALCTIHAAKGLEWPVVFVIGLNSKTFPSARSVKGGEIEDERRLAYVAISRAEDTLYLVNNAPSKKGDGRSQFMDEIENKGE